MLELNPSAQSCLPRFFTGILIFKGLTARPLYKSFGVKELIQYIVNCSYFNVQITTEYQAMTLCMKVWMFLCDWLISEVAHFIVIFIWAWLNQLCKLRVYQMCVRLWIMSNIRGYNCMFWRHNPSFTDWVQNVTRPGIFLNISRWYSVTILPIFLFVHWSLTDAT
jgi:hypothetical protein